ncbi:MAG: glycosyltransferase [Bacteroidales bacterium]|nr:glycosyltransferase [Bacteroidales bacterium]
MKIILFTDSLGAGGAQRQLVGLALMLKNEGLNIKVSTYFDIDFYKQYLDDNGVCNELIPDADNKKKRIFAVRSYLKKEKPDWVIAYQETPSLVASIAKLLGGDFKLIVSERNTTQSIGMNERVRFFLYRWADAIVPNSYSQEKFLVEHYSWMKTKIRTITNFVDLNRFSYVSRKRRKIPQILVVATIFDSKNAIGLIEAANILKNKVYAFCIKWYGYVDTYIQYYNQCVSLINKYKLNENFILLPKTKQIEEKYKEADYFCLPSFYEGTPNVICEACSTGLPVLCSDVCDNYIFVHERENGILFNPKSPIDIAEKIEVILKQSDEEYNNYCINSRKNAELLLSDNIFLQKYLKIINK